MDCMNVIRLMDRWLDGELGPEQARAVALHMEGCPSCSAQAAQALDLNRILDALPAPKAPGGLKRRILTAIRNEQDRFSLADWWRSLGAAARGAALAMALAGILLGGLMGRQTGTVSGTEQAQGPYANYILADNGDWL